MDLDEMLGSKVRRKIIRVLWKIGSTNITNLVQKTNTTYNQLVPQLLAFEKEGIISEKRYGRVRMITLEKENPKTILLLQALKILDKGHTQNRQSSSSVEAETKIHEPDSENTNNDFDVCFVFH